MKGAFVVTASLLTANPAKVHSSVPGTGAAIRSMDLERLIYIQLDCPHFNLGKNQKSDRNTFLFFSSSEALLNHQ